MAGGMIGNLSVGLTLNTEKFQRGAKQARSTADSLKASFVSLKTAVAGFGAAFTTGAMVRGWAQTANQMDAITDAAQRLGVSTESLGGLGHAAQLSGSSLEALSDSMDRMMRSGEAIKRLGIDAKTLDSMAADELFLAIADRIGEMKSRLDQSAAAMAVFGRRGQELLPMLTSGRDAIHALMEEAKRLGLIFTDLQANEVAAANDALDRMRAAWQGIKQTLTIEAAPAFEYIATSIAEATKSMNDLSRASGGMSMRFATIADVAHEIRTGFKLAQIAILDAVNATQQKFYELGEFITSYLEQLPGIGAGYSQQRISNAASAKASAAAYQAQRDKLTKEFTALFLGPTPSERMAKLIEGSAAKMQGSARVMEAVASASEATANAGASLAEVHRIQNAVDEFIEIHRPGMAPIMPQFDLGVRSLAALEFGTPAAFSQERRSNQQAHLLEKAQLEQQRAMRKSLESIDKNLRDTQLLEAANFTA